MKIRFIISLLFLFTGMIPAQEKSKAIVPSDGVIKNYMAETKAYAALYTGKEATSYDVPFTNHPYFETAGYVSGTLCYNHVVYKDILMCIDLFRDEITIIYPNSTQQIVLNNEKFIYAILNGSTIIKSVDENRSNVKFLNSYVLTFLRSYVPVMGRRFHLSGTRAGNAEFRPATCP
jgi:hypothetical protein